MKYYIYAHFDCKGDVFYIGRGCNKRAWQKNGRGSNWREVADNGYSVEIIRDELTLELADQLEEYVS